MCDSTLRHIATSGLLLLAMGLGTGCGALRERLLPAPKVVPPAPSGPERPAFQGARARGDAHYLAALGEREPGSPGAESARSHIRGVLEKQGLEVSEIVLPAEDAEGAEAPPLVHLVAELAGHSSDLLVLAATYGTGPGQASTPDGASGAALLLELGRSLTAEPQPYTVWLVFVDGAPDYAQPETLAASAALAEHWLEEGVLGRIRLAVVMDDVCRPDARMIRDASSHRSYREIFWRSARALGERDVFPPAASVQTAATVHLAWVGRGLRRVVALASEGPPAGAPVDAPAAPGEDATTGDGDARGVDPESPAEEPAAADTNAAEGDTNAAAADTNAAEGEANAAEGEANAAEGEAPEDASRVAAPEPPPCSAETLESVGAVSLHALADVTALWAKVDRLSPAPPAPPPPPDAGPSESPPADELPESD